MKYEVNKPLGSCTMRDVSRLWGSRSRCTTRRWRREERKLQNPARPDDEPRTLYYSTWYGVSYLYHTDTITCSSTS